MSKSIVRTVGPACLMVLSWAASHAQGAATVSLKAVAKNGTPIAATNTLTIAPNDTITAEVFIFGWATPPFDPPSNTGLVKTYQVSLSGAAGAISNGADPADESSLVLPVGWVAPVTRDSCPCDDPDFPNCNPQYGCTGSGFNANSMASIQTSCAGGSCAGGCCVSNLRSDFLFYGFDNFRSTDLNNLDIRWGATINGADAQLASRCAAGANAGLVVLSMPTVRAVHAMQPTSPMAAL